MSCRSYGSHSETRARPYSSSLDDPDHHKEIGDLSDVLLLLVAAVDYLDHQMEIGDLSDVLLLLAAARRNSG